MIGMIRITSIQATSATPWWWRPRMMSSSAAPHSRMNGVAIRMMNSVRRKSETAKTGTAAPFRRADRGSQRPPRRGNGAPPCPGGRRASCSRVVQAPPPMHTPAPLRRAGRRARLRGMARTRIGDAALDVRTAVAIGRGVWRLVAAGSRGTAAATCAAAARAAFHPDRLMRDRPRRCGLQSHDERSRAGPTTTRATCAPTSGPARWPAAPRCRRSRCRWRSGPARPRTCTCRR